MAAQDPSNNFPRKSRELKYGDTAKVVVVYAQSPNAIFVRDIIGDAEFHKWMADLQKSGEKAVDVDPFKI